MPSILGIPKVQLIAVLLLIFAASIIKFPFPETFYLLLLPLGFCVFFDLLFTYSRRRVFFFPYAAIATGLIIGLIINQSAGIFQIAVTSALAMGIKNFLRISGRHIFNPAASGLFLSSLVFGEYFGWWGVSSIPYFILLMPGLIAVFRFKKYYAIFSYLIITYVMTKSAINFNPSTLFFALVMLPEPMTSPVKMSSQLIYGSLVAIIPFIFAINPVSNFFIKTNITFDPLLFALLLGNLIFFKLR